MAGQSFRYRIFETAAGPFALISRGSAEVSAAWIATGDGGALTQGATCEADLLPQLGERLSRYFAGEPVDFDDVPTPAGPPFYRRCWDACRSIRRGETRTYGELAVLAGASQHAARAGGQAMRRNPLPVIVPCHRVVGSGGRLHGYGGSRDPEGRELAIKGYLLALERRATPR